MMELAIWVALAIIVAYVVSGIAGITGETRRHIVEKFTAPPRADIGFARDGWEEESGYERDLRYSESFADVQGLGVAADFCRAVQRRGDPDSLRMVCALGRRDGFDTMEYRSRSRGEGFRWSRDDYFKRDEKNSGRMDYCRIVKDEMTGEWYSSCAVAGRDGFNVIEERDTAPPPHIRQLLEAYEGIATWFRFFDDVEDYAGNSVVEFHGRPTPPSLLKAEVSRGLQFNRRPEEKETRDYVRWGDPGTLTLEHPRQIRAIAFWVWLDVLDGSPRVLDCANEGGKRDRVWIGVEGGDRDLPAARGHAMPAAEVRPAEALALGSQTEPLTLRDAMPPSAQEVAAPKDSASWVFEIWDGEQRIMRLAAPHTARAGQWQHVVLTTTDATAWWPTWQLWVNGEVAANRVEGRTIPAASLTENFLGRGLRGCIQDFRVYTEPMPATKIAAARRWMEGRLHPSP
jgi:hypothetical protein